MNYTDLITSFSTRHHCQSGSGQAGGCGSRFQRLRGHPTLELVAGFDRRPPREMSRDFPKSHPLSFTLPAGRTSRPLARSNQRTFEGWSARCATPSPTSTSNSTPTTTVR